MARSWRNDFILFVIILNLVAQSIAVIPNYELMNATHTSGSIHMKFTGLLSQNFVNYMNPLKRLQLTDSYGKWEINNHDVSRNLTAYNYSIDELNRINEMIASNQTRVYQNQVKPPNSLTRHGPIIIRSDEDFASQGWPGNGTRENPYHIADLQFLVIVTYSMVRISNTRVHFIVSNCWMEKQSGTDVEIGIKLTNVTNGVIVNTVFTGLHSGAIIHESEANDLVNNSCFNIDEGFTVFHSNTTSLVNNTCYNSRRGILVRESNSITITNNTCFDADFGLLIFDSFSTQIINNTIRNSRYFGCEIYPVYDNILANNSLVNCGFFFGAWEEMSWVGFTDAPTRVGVGSSVDVNTQITGNTVNQRPLLLFLGRVDFTVPLGGGQIILLNCSSVTVQDQNLMYASIAIFLCFTKRSRVFNNTCIGNSVNGIRMQNCEYITVNNNLCNNNSISGMTLDQTVNTSLTENRCNYNSWGSGIHLIESYDNQLLNNTCLDNFTGIRLEPAFGTELLNNTCNQNRHGYDWLGGFQFSGAGILISGNTNIARGNFCNDNYIGINIWGQENYVGENTCTNNTIGILLNGDSTPIANNLCVNDRIGIYIYRYLETIIIDNSMVGCGLYIEYRGSEWTADVLIHGNSVNGRPLIFYKNQMNRQVPLGAGQIILFNCQRIIVREQTLTGCSDGILVYCTNDSIFANNALRDNTLNGIQAFDSHNNHYTLNIFTNNEAVGLYLRGDSQNNIVDWNVFLCNASHDARDHGPEFQNPNANIFDCNYWANYSGYDLYFNGFGDIPYNVSGIANTCDLHPLMSPTIVLVKRTVGQLLPLLESVAILVLVIIVFVIVRAKLKYSSPTSPNNLRSTLT